MLDVGYVNILMLWSGTLILCQRKSKWDYVGIPRIPGWPPLDIVEPNVKCQFADQDKTSASDIPRLLGWIPAG